MSKLETRGVVETVAQLSDSRKSVCLDTATFNKVLSVVISIRMVWPGVHSDGNFMFTVVLERRPNQAEVRTNL